MPTPSDPPPSRRPAPDVGVLIWMLAGLAGAAVAALVAASGRFGHLAPPAEILVAAGLGGLAMLAAAPWKQIAHGSVSRREIRRLIEALDELGDPQRRRPLSSLLTERRDDIGALRRGIHRALTDAAADRLEAGRLRRTMRHSIRRETDRATGRLRREATTDPLTGLGNRRALAQRLAELADECGRQRTPLTALMIDVDRFKQVNDRLGHDAGDACLASLGRLLGGGVRHGDCAFRSGGDEFVVLMPGAPGAAGLKVARRLTALFGQMAWPHAQLPRPTLSIGLAVRLPGDTEPPGRLLRRADEAMYAVKRTGRGAVTTDVELPGAA